MQYLAAVQVLPLVRRQFRQQLQRRLGGAAAPDAHDDGSQQQQRGQPEARLFWRCGGKSRLSGCTLLAITYY